MWVRRVEEEQARRQAPWEFTAMCTFYDCYLCISTHFKGNGDYKIFSTSELASISKKVKMRILKFFLPPPKCTDLFILSTAWYGAPTVLGVWDMHAPNTEGADTLWEAQECSGEFWAQLIWAPYNNGPPCELVSCSSQYCNEVWESGMWETERLLTWVGGWNRYPLSFYYSNKENQVKTFLFIQ